MLDASTTPLFTSLSKEDVKWLTLRKLRPFISYNVSSNPSPFTYVSNYTDTTNQLILSEGGGNACGVKQRRKRGGMIPNSKSGIATHRENPVVNTRESIEKKGMIPKNKKGECDTS